MERKYHFTSFYGRVRDNVFQKWKVETKILVTKHFVTSSFISVKFPLHQSVESAGVAFVKVPM